LTEINPSIATVLQKLLWLLSIMYQQTTADVDSDEC